MITDDRAEKACEFIRDNAQRHGQLKGAKAFHEHEIKRRKAIAYISSEGSVAERQAHSEIDEDVRAAISKLIESITEESELADKIKAAELTYEIWRTQQANMRKGA